VIKTDLRKELESRIAPSSSFAEIVAAFEEVCRTPVYASDETLLFSAMRNSTFTVDRSEAPLFGSFDACDKKCFCVSLEREYEPDSESGECMLLSLTLCYPGALWNLGMIESELCEQDCNAFFEKVRSFRSFRYLSSHACTPLFVQVHFGKAA